MATLFPKPGSRKVTGPWRWNQAGLGGPGLKGHKYLSWQTCPGLMVFWPVKEGSTVEPLFCPHCLFADSGLSFLISQMGYNWPCPSFQGHWEGRRKGREKWAGYSSCPGSSSASGGRRRPRLRVPLNSQVTRGGSSCSGPRSPRL